MLTKNIPGTYWFGRPIRARTRFYMAGKMVQIEKMTECSLGNEMNETDGGECTIDEGTEKPSFRVGEDIASVLARLGDEDMGYFHSRLKVETKIKRTG